MEQEPVITKVLAAISSHLDKSQKHILDSIVEKFKIDKVEIYDNSGYILYKTPQGIRVKIISLT